MGSPHREQMHHVHDDFASSAQCAESSKDHTSNPDASTIKRPLLSSLRQPRMGQTVSASCPKSLGAVRRSPRSFESDPLPNSASETKKEYPISFIKVAAVEFFKGREGYFSSSSSGEQSRRRFEKWKKLGREQQIWRGRTLTSRRLRVH